ncbi:hypothetical protein BD779DRAFT_1475632 [Infundibulicybe gibba]|nr:hypothetical protein BD779DRAFT_1475632 [Infundibulicybe gibba]
MATLPQQRAPVHQWGLLGPRVSGLVGSGSSPPREQSINDAPHHTHRRNAKHHSGRRAHKSRAAGAVASSTPRQALLPLLQALKLASREVVPFVLTPEPKYAWTSGRRRTWPRCRCADAVELIRRTHSWAGPTTQKRTCGIATAGVAAPRACAPGILRAARQA